MIADEDTVDHISKNSQPLVKVMFALMVLFVLKVVQSSVHNTCGGGHA